MSISMSVIDICLGLRSPLEARRKKTRASVTGAQLAEVAAVEEATSSVTPAAAVMTIRRSLIAPDSGQGQIRG